MKDPSLIDISEWELYPRWVPSPALCVDRIVNDSFAVGRRTRGNGVSGGREILAGIRRNQKKYVREIRTAIFINLPY